MCGIAGTIFTRAYHPGTRVDRAALTRALAVLRRGSRTPDRLLHLAWEYKSNVNFLRYCREPGERAFANHFAAQLARLAATHSAQLTALDRRLGRDLLIKHYDATQQLLDCRWFFHHEIPRWRNDIRALAGLPIETLPDSAIIFYKQLATIINAINFLEIRGRDSFGLALQLAAPRGAFADAFPDTTARVTNGAEMSMERLVSGHREVAVFLFKTANRIGALGDNAARIRALIAACRPLHALLAAERAETGTIVAHTRWASAGEVHIANCHPIANILDDGSHPAPLVMAAMNGDIYNYAECLAAHRKRLGVRFDPLCTTDCLAIPAAFSDTGQPLTAARVRDIVRAFTGSFAIAVQSTQTSDAVVLCNRGNQGLYLGRSADGLMFASDVYGLIESCRHFMAIPSGTVIALHAGLAPAASTRIAAETFDGRDRTLSLGECKTTTITTRDIHKGAHAHFLHKEIHETRQILERTLLRYCELSAWIDPRTLAGAITGDARNIPPAILERLRDGTIREIIITGMGTCYTAAVAIAGYMRHMLRHFIPAIIVQPHVASEGSAFYLQDDMRDTLVIVIAQSGTTVDTNVYVQMAKDRGAASLAIVNKREGDITFIVDGTCYIGNGRDIEIAVPSTKTYTAQVILGYILTLRFCCALHATHRGHTALLRRHLRLLASTPRLTGRAFRAFPTAEVERRIAAFVRPHTAWYVAVDDSPNAVCGMEIRIKYSESCYHSLPYLHIADCLAQRVRHAFITYCTTKPYREIAEACRTLLRRGNHVVLITTGEGTKAAATRNPRLLTLNMPSVDPFYAFLPTILAGQLLSYYAALSLDGRKAYFARLKTVQASGSSAAQALKAWRAAVKAGHFNQGFSKRHVEQLMTAFRAGKNPADLLDRLYDFARRPIDTIKHQAKTITVGAVRQAHAHDAAATAAHLPATGPVIATSAGEVAAFLRSCEDPSLDAVAARLHDGMHCFIHPCECDEAFGYYAAHYLQAAARRLGLTCHFHLAQSYDVQDPHKDPHQFWCLVHPRRPARAKALARHIAPDRRHCCALPLAPRDAATPLALALRMHRWVAGFAGALARTHGQTAAWREWTARETHELFGARTFAASAAVTPTLVAAARLFAMRNNWKLLGSGVNYNLCKFATKCVIGALGRSAAFDVLENHKHIDISAEAAVLAVIANIPHAGYQSDVRAELDKLLSHNNAPVILTNTDDARFDGWASPTLKMPRVGEGVAFPATLAVIDRWIRVLKDQLGRNTRAEPGASLITAA
ncbi:MAG: SIS domain-containing protein [Deltaproteobacteria bacterium]|nr:SIS domain-containing protein [Deltaproteobacteria bacterium]